MYVYRTQLNDATGFHRQAWWYLRSVSGSPKMIVLDRRADIDTKYMGGKRDRR